MNNEKKGQAKWEKYVAVRYAAVDRGDLQRHYREWIGPYAEVAPRRVLDIGVGSGAHLAALADCLPGAALHGFDVSEEFVARARAELERRNVPAELVVGAPESYPYPDRSFDLVISHGSMGYASDDRKFLAECCRLLDVGGLLWISTAGFRRFVGRLVSGSVYQKVRLTTKMISGALSMTIGFKPIIDTPITEAWMRRNLVRLGTTVLRLEGPRIVRVVARRTE